MTNILAPAYQRAPPQAPFRSGDLHPTNRLIIPRHSNSVIIFYAVTAFTRVGLFISDLKQEEPGYRTRLDNKVLIQTYSNPAT